MSYNFLEDLPKSCPPPGSIPTKGTYYRFIGGDSISEEDLKPHYRLFPGLDFGDKLCMSMGISIYTDIDKAKKQFEKTRKLPRNKKRIKNICQIELKETDGLFCYTGGDGHCTWWLDKSFILNI